MHWLYLLFAFGALLVAITTAHTWLLALSLVAALVLFVAWAVMQYRHRVGDSNRDVLTMIDPAELRRMRELAEARRAAGADGQAGSPQPGDPGPPHSA